LLKITCRKCKGEEFVYRMRGDHIGEYCEKSNAWMVWVTEIPEILATLEKEHQKK
jgi:hypothetical protein